MIVKYCPYCEGEYDQDTIHCPNCMAMLREVEQEEVVTNEVQSEPDEVYTPEMIAEMEKEADEGDTGNTHENEVPTASPESLPKRVVISKKSRKRMKRKLSV